MYINILHLLLYVHIFFMYLQVISYASHIPPNTPTHTLVLAPSHVYAHTHACTHTHVCYFQYMHILTLTHVHIHTCATSNMIFLCVTGSSSRSNTKVRPSHHWNTKAVASFPHQRKISRWKCHLPCAAMSHMPPLPLKAASWRRPDWRPQTRRSLLLTVGRRGKTVLTELAMSLCLYTTGLTLLGTLQASSIEGKQPQKCDLLFLDVNFTLCAVQLYMWGVELSVCM